MYSFLRKWMASMAEPAAHNWLSPVAAKKTLDTDLNGDRLSDLLIAIEGSTDVLLLLNRQLLAEP